MSTGRRVHGGVTSTIALAAVVSYGLTLGIAPANASTTCTVVSTAASGPGSLAQALTDLETSKGTVCSRIVISVTGVIAVSAPLPVIRYAVEIVGPGREALTLDGGKARPVLPDSAVRTA